MRSNLALLALLFCVIAFTSCSIEKRIYEKGYHISWLHPKPKTPLADVSQGCSKGASQDLPQDFSVNLETGASQDLPQDLSVNLSKNQESKTPSDTITPTKKEDDYFGQKDYSKSNNKGDKPQNITELKKETKDNFKVALFGFVGWAVSLGLLSINDWSTLDSLKAAIILIILGTACALLFLIFLPIAIFRLFKLAFLKLRGKPDEHKINQQSQKD
jgi:hypothetical protein